MFKVIPVLLLIVYVWGAWKFIKGFKNTSYGQNSVLLALFWPILIIGNRSFRQNFQKALRS